MASCFAKTTEEKENLPRAKSMLSPARVQPQNKFSVSGLNLSRYEVVNKRTLEDMGSVFICPYSTLTVVVRGLDSDQGNQLQIPAQWVI